jgi:hypothetical protein
MRKKKLLKKYTQTYDIVVSEKKNWIIWRGAHRRETYKIYNEKKKKLIRGGHFQPQNLK